MRHLIPVLSSNYLYYRTFSALAQIAPDEMAVIRATVESVCIPGGGNVAQNVGM
ncbi:MAG TPA: hypothetical protein VH187_01885 [Scandinavium sp.]|jgi:hypothetical protein|uniref:hypothetical protein n=1 Tax=Scandinavium sp. TaxID=2830653 RepID=UPI002E377155|nr:hypothetical protein [Scandinavium sp.]HEX4499909.1 hypothetical protein [Scandinavium sp.]